MGVIVVLIIFSLLVALTFLGAFFWAVKTGQFDDPQTPSIRMLFNDEPPSKEHKTLTNKTD
ncbi:MAG: cbb3-type cytochrome oxidase assembly protein CcoS [Balneola sp.]|nr:MAG: cbb3-type cytochrome oxidase assembly protein CcoS [Balneola sp.]